MQALWTRVAHVRSHCGCPGCRPSRWLTPTPNRRVTTSTRWRLLKPIHSATFFYSAVFATAAVLDGEVKKQRRLELDNALEEARRELGNERAVDDGAPEPLRSAEALSLHTIKESLVDDIGTDESRPQSRWVSETLRTGDDNPPMTGCDFRPQYGNAAEPINHDETAAGFRAAKHSSNLPTAESDAHEIEYTRHVKKPTSYSSRIVQTEDETSPRVLAYPEYAHNIDSFRPFVEAWEEDAAGSLRFRQFLKTLLNGREYRFDADFLHPSAWLHEGNRKMFLAETDLERLGLVASAAAPLNDLVTSGTAEHIDLAFVWNHRPATGTSWPRLPGAHTWRLATPNSHFGPESIWSQGTDRAKALDRLPWTDRKLVTADVSVAVMICKLLLECDGSSAMWKRVHGDGSPALRTYISGGKKKLRDSMQGLQKMLQSLRFHADRTETVTPPGVSLPFFRQSASGGHHAMVDELNQHVTTTLQMFNEEQISVHELLVKVADRFLSSPVPPNVTTYNLLLQAFNTAQYTQFFDAVLTSMFETHQRVNEVTCSLVYDHCSKTNRPAKLWYFYQLTKGEFGGLQTFVTPKGQISGFSKVARWSHHTPNKALVVMREDPLVTWYLIRSMVRFMNLSSVTDWWSRVPSHLAHRREVLLLLLRKAVVYRDWSRGREFFELLTRAFRKGKKRYMSPEESLLGLSLCKMCDRQTELAVITKWLAMSGLDVESLMVAADQFCAQIISIYNEHRVPVCEDRDPVKWQEEVPGQEADKPSETMWKIDVGSMMDAQSQATKWINVEDVREPASTVYFRSMEVESADFPMGQQALAASPL